jgi:hypothetical protein
MVFLLQVYFGSTTVVGGKGGKLLKAAGCACRKKSVIDYRYYSYQSCECVQVWYLEVCLHNHCEVGIVRLRHVLLVLAQLDCYNVAQVRTWVIPAQQQTVSNSDTDQ